ncbi:MAG: hypothetical protein LQ348_003222 [Seirophora lacunosa]|nr:MAG: hypothetical protein LQ348_003222 [Seirophora lacunosa]
MSPAELEPFLQNWLFFGLLHEVLQDMYRHEDFVTISVDNGVEKSIITTAKLSSRLEEFEVKMKKQDETSIQAVYKHIARCLNLTYACLNVDFPTCDNDLKFHLASVSELIGFALSKACSVGSTDSTNRSLVSFNWGTANSKRFQKSVLLDRSGCCPSKTEMFIEEFGNSAQALSFLAACVHGDGVQLSHASCDERTCRSATSSKVPHHVSDSCGCKLLQIDEKLLADCLEKGCLPLLRIREETDLDEMTVEVIASTDSTCYVALSHVWADGLGNPKATALPRCQLSRLKSLVDNLDFNYLPWTAASELLENASEMLLWCDTLCCPVQDKEAKKMALQQMYRTYESASVVLVLGRGLTSHREGRASVIQECLRVATSRWMTRLWTLQEGALPAKKNRLWFQFTKTAWPLSFLHDSLFEVFGTDIHWRGVIEGVFRRLTTFTFLFKNANFESHGADFQSVSRGLLYRSVTVPSDEPLLIATLMGLDLSRILACKPRKRMIILWRMIATAPSGVDKDILFHTVPKLKRRGLRWAPRSLLFANIPFARPVAGEPEDRAVLAKVGNTKGLVAQLAGLRISIARCANGLPGYLAGFDSLPRDHDIRYRLYLKGRQGSWYTVTHRRGDSLDPPSDSEDLYASMSKLKNPWILYIGVEIGYRALLTDQTSEKKQQSPHDEPFCVKIIEQVNLVPLPLDLNKRCRVAHLLAHRDLAPSAAARAVDELVTAGVKPDSPVLQEALQGLARETERLSRSPAAVDELAANGIPSVDESGYTLLRELIVSMYRGHYLQVEDDAPGDSKWCID